MARQCEPGPAASMARRCLSGSAQQYRGFRWWNKGGGSRTSNNHFTRDVLRADGTKAYVGYGVDSLTVGLVAVCRVKFAGETRDAVASLYPTAEEARITCAIVDAAAKVRDLNFNYVAEGKGATLTARFGQGTQAFAGIARAPLVG